MAIELKIVTIKNSTFQLNALPVGESVFVVSSAKPNPSDLSKIFLTRVDSDQFWPNPGDPNAVQVSYVKQTYGTVPVSYNVSQSGAEWLIEVKPKEPLYPNSQYVLFVEHGIRAEYAVITKPTTLGNSSISVESLEGNLTDVGVYEIIITQTSQLSNGQHNIKYTLMKDDGVVVTDTLIDINKAKLSLNPNTKVVFNNKVPFLNGERFIVTLTDVTATTTSKYQNISTYLDAEVIKSEDNPSTRADYEDLVTFYQNFGFGQASTAPVPPAQSAVEPTITYVDLKSFIVEFPVDINTAALTPSSFAIDFSYAFNNYQLENMGLYSTDSKYVVEYKVLDTKRILFTFKQDSTNTVPAEQKYVIVNA